MSDGCTQLGYYLRYSSDSLDFAWFNEVECFYLPDDGA